MEKYYYTLNDIYERINHKRDQIITVLAESGFELFSGYFSGHFCKLNDAFFEEKYPIPVITVNEVIDIGIDIDNIFLEFRITKEIALNIEYQHFDRPFELYGLKEFLDDLHNGEMELVDIKQRIRDSIENEFGLAFSFNYDEDVELLLEIVENLLYI